MLSQPVRKLSQASDNNTLLPTLLLITMLINDINAEELMATIMVLTGAAMGLMITEARGDNGGK